MIYRNNIVNCGFPITKEGDFREVYNWREGAYRWKQELPRRRVRAELGRPIKSGDHDPVYQAKKPKES